MFGLERGLQDTPYDGDDFGTARLEREIEGLLLLGEFGGATAELEAWLLRRVRFLEIELTPSHCSCSKALRVQWSGSRDWSYR